MTGASCRRGQVLHRACEGARSPAPIRPDGWPVKPSPEPVLQLCRSFRVPPQATWVIGDYLFDIQSGNAAGATTVLLIGDDSRPDYAGQARYVIRRLHELMPLMTASTPVFDWKF